MRIRELLKERKMTQHDLATKMGITDGGLSQLISGQYAIRLDTLERIAEAIGVEVAELFAPTIKCPHCGQSIVVTGVASVNDK